MKGNGLTLAIEAAVRGGSISLLQEGRELVSTKGPANVSRAEDLLLTIQDLFKNSGTDIGSVGLIAVSNGPGSFTGIRIGLATALGLAASLKVPCFGISLLVAAANCYSGQSDRVIALPVGRKDVCWQTFRTLNGIAKEIHTVRGGRIEDFRSSISEISGADIYIERDLFNSLELNPLPHSRAFPIEVDLAFVLGLAAVSGNFASNTDPLYVQNSHPASKIY